MEPRLLAKKAVIRWFKQKGLVQVSTWLALELVCWMGSHQDNTCPMYAHPCFSKLFDTSMASFLNVSPQFLTGVARHGKTSKTEKALNI